MTHMLLFYVHKFALVTPNGAILGSTAVSEETVQLVSAGW